MSIRVLLWLLIVGAVVSVAGAITGSGTVTDRVWALGSASVCGVGAWGIHRRAAFTWPLGWAVLVLGAVLFVAQAAASLLPQPHGWAGVLGVAFGAVLGVAYWGTWWHRHREYFSPEGTPPGWRPDLT